MSNRTDKPHKIKLTRKCWAGGDGCYGPITKEHVVSDGILKHIGPLSTSISNMKLGSGSFVIRSLCERHNRLLSQYDDEAIKFFNGFYSFICEKDERNRSNSEVITINVNGYKLEKWFAKTLFNHSLFQAAVLGLDNHLSPLATHSIYNKLFSDENFNEPFGLYFVKPDKPIGANLSLNSWSFCPQFGHHMILHKKVKKQRQYNHPNYYYTKMGPFELIGFFNLLNLDDEFALNSVLRSTNKNLENRALYRQVKFGFNTIDAKSDPNRIVQVNWD
jgi:hypothetical protein